MLFMNRFLDKDVNILNYLYPSGYVFTRDEGFTTNIHSFGLVPCLDLYGDDPDLRDYFKDSYSD